MKLWYIKPQTLRLCLFPEDLFNSLSKLLIFALGIYFFYTSGGLELGYIGRHFYWEMVLLSISLFISTLLYLFNLSQNQYEVLKDREEGREGRRKSV